MANKVEIANFALTELGAPPILSLDDDVVAAGAISNVFDICRRKVLREHTWRFARARVALAPLTTPPAFDFANQFELPALFIRIVSIKNDPKYEIEGNNLLCDESVIYLRYIYDIEERLDLMDDLGAQALGFAIASTVSYKITQDLDVKNAMEVKYAQVLARAKSMDSREMPFAEVDADEWLSARVGHPGLMRSNR